MNQSPYDDIILYTRTHMQQDSKVIWLAVNPLQFGHSLAVVNTTEWNKTSSTCTYVILIRRAYETTHTAMRCHLAFRSRR